MLVRMGKKGSCAKLKFLYLEFFRCRYLAATHFEPTHARSAFPCFDEPQFKAKFRLTIFRDRFHIALFNTPVVNTEDLGFYMGMGLVRFFHQILVLNFSIIFSLLVSAKGRLSRNSRNQYILSSFRGLSLFKLK